MGIVNELKSFIPGGPQVRIPLPAVGEKVPASPLNLAENSNSVIVFLRHSGCPLCEASFRQAIQLAPKYQDINYIVVMHAEQSVILEYIAEVLADIEVDWVPNNVRVEADPERMIYAAYGVGTIPLAKMLDMDSIKRAQELAAEGIKPRATHGSRWQNNGGFAVDKTGTIRWAFLADKASDIANLQHATDALLPPPSTPTSPTSPSSPTNSRRLPSSSRNSPTVGR